jgi:hypothetical protein
MAKGKRGRIKARERQATWKRQWPNANTAHKQVERAEERRKQRQVAGRYVW